MLPKMYKIIKIVNENSKVKTFYFKGRFRSYTPGQFIMLWLPGVDEKPFSLSFHEKGKFSVTVEVRGRYTKGLFKLKKGDFLGIRGPFGHGFNVKKGKKCAIVTGGIGIFGVSAIAKMLPKAKIFYGVRSKSQICFSNIFKMNICTDDGSYGPKKFVTELFHDEIDNFDIVYTCGPELMMRELAKMCKTHKVNLEASTERIMKCGIGFCASCVCDDKLVCKDGPVFTGIELLSMKDFGKRALLKSGRIGTLNEYHMGL